MSEEIAKVSTKMLRKVHQESLEKARSSLVKCPLGHSRNLLEKERIYEYQEKTKNQKYHSHLLLLAQFITESSYEAHVGA